MIKINFNSLSKESQNSWTIPEFYEDEIIKCRVCNSSFIFTAEKQKEWYEEKKKYFYMRPVLCKTHYLESLKNKKLKNLMDEKINEFKNNESRKTKLGLAKAIISFYEQTGNGYLNKAIWCLKECRKENYKIKELDHLLRHITRNWS